MLPNAFPTLLFVTNLCAMDKIGHLFKSNSWFQRCASYHKKKDITRKENVQLTSKMLKPEEISFLEKQEEILQAVNLNTVLTLL